ncbi:hypothetical protein [uncultured Aquimarina sp.]|uniref:hypothetical protein n=1 Tax=uncultured Aquimarina sp. TaxID=575652 RepID=UPI0026059FDD|nr:hypothetical protein [uncultured Aquimarina sp.]
MDDEHFTVELVTSPETISLQDLSTFKIGLLIINKTNKPIHFDVSKTKLFVDDRRSFSWDLAVQNGAIINLKVNSKKTEIVDWPLGKALFSEEGTYVLRLEWKESIQNKTIVIL